VVQVPDERPASAITALEQAAAFFAAQGVHIERVLTDNGKAERLIKTLLGERAYARPYRSNVERLAALPDWVDFYNHGRPHTAIGGLTPHQALVHDLSVNHT
jgi:transposase InsO family protein